MHTPAGTSKGLLAAILLVVSLAGPARGDAAMASPSPELPRLYVGRPDGKEWLEMQEGRRLIFDASSYPRQPARLTEGPIVSRDGAGITIRFALDRYDDVLVRIVDKNGSTVRNLACGVLGVNAPEPLQSGRLAQELVWDLKDDEGRPVAPSGCRVCVSTGLTPRFDRFAASDPQQVPYFVAGLEVDPQGRVYVCEIASRRGRDNDIQRYDREGKYLDSPFWINPNLIDKNRLPGILTYGWSEVDGQPVPGLSAIFSSDIIVRSTAGGQEYVHPLRIAADGQAYFEAWNRERAGQTYRGLTDIIPVSLDPVLSSDRSPRGRYGIFMNVHERWAPAPKKGLAYWTRSAYFKGVAATPVLFKADIATGRPIAEFDYNGTEPLSPRRAFLGTENQPGDGPQHFRSIRDIAVDEVGRIFVADKAGLKVYESSGKLVALIQHYDLEGQRRELGSPTDVRPTKDAIYVLARQGEKVHNPVWSMMVGQSATLLKLSPDLARPHAIWVAPLHGLARYLAVDTSRSPTLLWVGNGSGPATFTRIVDEGERAGDIRHIGGVRQGVLLDPGVIALDGRGRLFVMDNGHGFVRTNDGGSEWLTSWIGCRAVSIDRKRGHLYWNQLRACYRCDLDLKGDKQFAIKLDRPEVRGTFNQGAVDEEGNLYLAVENRIDQFGPDGKLKKRGYCELFLGTGAVAMDRKGAIYTMDTAFPKDPNTRLFQSTSSHMRGTGPRGMTFEVYHNLGLYTESDGKAAAFVFKRGEKLIRAQSDAAYLVKFAPGGGKRASQSELWAHPGVSSVSGGGCSCDTETVNNLAVDDSGRVFATDWANFHVKVLDAAGNLIGRVGAYGNRDCQGPNSKFPKPEIAFVRPLSLAVQGDSLYVSDPTLRRVVKVRLEYRQRKETAVP